MLRPSTCWARRYPVRPGAGPATSGSSPLRAGWTARAAGATGTRVWSSPEKPVTSDAASGRGWAALEEDESLRGHTSIPLADGSGCRAVWAEDARSPRRREPEAEASPALTGWLAPAHGRWPRGSPAASPRPQQRGRACPPPVAPASPQRRAAGACGEQDWEGILAARKRRWTWWREAGCLQVGLGNGPAGSCLSPTGPGGVGAGVPGSRNGCSHSPAIGSCVPGWRSGCRAPQAEADDQIVRDDTVTARAWRMAGR
jgi:hypothetical protein